MGSNVYYDRVRKGFGISGHNPPENTQWDDRKTMRRGVSN